MHRPMQSRTVAMWKKQKISLSVSKVHGSLKLCIVHFRGIKSRYCIIYVCVPVERKVLPLFLSRSIIFKVYAFLSVVLMLINTTFMRK